MIELFVRRPVLVNMLMAGLIIAGVRGTWHYVLPPAFGALAGMALACRARRRRIGSPRSARRQIRILPDPMGCEPVPVRVGRHAKAPRAVIVRPRQPLRRSG